VNCFEKVSLRTLPAPPQDQVEPHIEAAIVDMAIEQPAFGQVRIANELTKRGLFGSAFILHSAFGRTFYQSGFRLPDKLWPTLPSRIFGFLLGICSLLGALDQLIHVR
jgi:hypothetical protein